MPKQTPLVFNNPSHWQARADEVRRVADQMTDEEGRQRMLLIAEHYEAIADRAVKRLKAQALGRRPLVSDEPPT